MGDQAVHEPARPPGPQIPIQALLDQILQAALGNLTAPGGELDLLVTMALDERADALGEITAQSDEFLTFFIDFLGFSPSSYPGPASSCTSAFSSASWS